MPVQTHYYLAKSSPNGPMVLNLKLFLQDPKARDVHAFKVFYHQYAASIYGAMLIEFKDESTAIKMLEITFSTVWERFYELDVQKCTSFTWLNRIARNCIKQQMT